MDNEAPDGEYFSLLRGSHAHTPNSLRSAGAMSIGLPSNPSQSMVVLATLQYLPVPILVLSSYAEVTLANEAMGRLLGIDWSATAVEGLSVTDVLMGKNISELGIEILQNGSPVLVSWEVRQHCRVEH